MHSFVSVVEGYLSSFENKFELMLELVGRYGQFHNIVMSVEENLGEIFRSYGEMYFEIVDKPEVKFNFWKAAYGMWS